MHSITVCLPIIAITVIGFDSPTARAEPVTPVEQLTSLKSLVGSWTANATGPNGVAIKRQISYRWIHNGRFLCGESSREIAGKVTTMTITYLWDPKDKLVRAWILSSDGDWSQAVVDVKKGEITLRSAGITTAGQSMKLTSHLRAINDNTRTESWDNIEIDGKEMPIPPQIRWSRTD
jgi:hypothetical protein